MERALERDEPLPRLLLAARRAKGWSQGRVMAEAGISRMDIYRFERGIYVPSAAKALGLCVALEIPPAVMRAAIEGDARTTDVYISALGTR